MTLFYTIVLFVFTALAEIIGCYLPWLVVKENKSYWLLIPAAISLIIFAWLLTLHPTEAGRVYAAYGGIYVITALLWLNFVDGISLTKFDILGSVCVFIGFLIIILQPTTIK